MEKRVGTADGTIATIIGTMLRFMINVDTMQAEGRTEFMKVPAPAFGLQVHDLLIEEKFIIQSLRSLSLQ